MSQKKPPHQGIQNGLKTKHQTTKLFKTVILPAVSYGHAGMGMCPSSIQRKRAMAADSCGKRNQAACVTTILHLFFGESGDPATWFPLDQLRTWLELRSEKMGHRLEKIDVAHTWSAASNNVRKKSRWSMVRGPMTATMATLHDLSIIPASPWKWYPAENPDVDWTCSGGDPGPFPSEMQQRLSHKVWGQAALHNHGLGAENGVNMTVLHKHHKQLVARGAHVRAGMQNKIATAQIYDGSRVCEHNPGAHVACVLCGPPDDPMFHRICDCPCIPASFDLDKTEQLVDETREKPTPFPSSGFVASRRVTGTQSCQSPRTRLLRTLARWTSWVVTFSQMGAGVLRPKTLAFVVVVLVSRGSS